MDILDLLQWPAMLVTVIAAWLVASRSAHSSSSHERTTLPWRQVSARRPRSMSSSGRAASRAKPSASDCIIPYSMPLWIILA